MDERFEMVVFDLDGTLIDTAPEIAAAVNGFLAHYRWPALDLPVVTRWIGRGTRSLLVEAIADATGMPADQVRASQDFEEHVRTFDRCYDAHCGTTSRLYPGVRDVLFGLDQAGVQLAIVTNKEQRYTSRVLRAHGLEKTFERVVSGDTLDTRKPHPAGLLACLAAGGIQPGRALFIGDSSIDAETARRAGVRVWLLPHGYNMGQPVEQEPADRIVADFAEIGRLLAPGCSSLTHERSAQ